MPTAILVDGSFYIKRYREIFQNDSNGPNGSPDQVAKYLFKMALDHLSDHDGQRRELYRIFFYDCAPFMHTRVHPISGENFDFSRTEEAGFRRRLHDELRRLRKLALRLGHLGEGRGWQISGAKTRALLAGDIETADLEYNDVFFDFRQKGVDMKIGLDIASLAYKRLVDQIILVAGDSDFVSAAKLARREGIDFVLDPMWHPIHSSLLEHIDGLRSTCPRPPAPEQDSPPEGGQPTPQEQQEAAFAAHSNGKG
jgi:uncharacterized LabA/DUF88 family protein